DDEAEQVGRLQAAVAEHQHRPALGDGTVQAAQQLLPVRPPGLLDPAGQDFPGDGDGDATDHDADTQDVEAVGQVGDVDVQRQLAAGPQRQDPAEQGGEAGGDVEVLALVPLLDAGLGGGFLVELGQAFAQGSVRAASVLGQEQGDGGQAAG